MATSASIEGEKFIQNSVCITVDFILFKSQEEKKLSEIYSTFCALMNSHGGQLTLSLDNGDMSAAKGLSRRIRQRFEAILGVSCARCTINLISICAREMIYNVSGLPYLCTLHSNIYIPTDLQALPLKSTQELKRILQPNRIIELDKLIKRNDYIKDLVSGQPLTANPVNLECKTRQYKLVAAEKVKRTTLGDRMTNSTNKFPNYVSAFANYRGGHIYYGVDDDGIVRGECVKDRDEVIRKVRNAINKVVWPSENEVDGRFKPVEGQHWDVFFEPVKDQKGRMIRNNFVIVVYISYRSGGVFADEPESYHIVDREVVKIPFEEWKKRTVDFACTIHTITRSCFRTTESEDRYFKVMEKMMDLRNQNAKQFTLYVENANKTVKTIDVRLSILTQTATCAFRLGNFSQAEAIIKEYDSLHPHCEENSLIPECMGLYIKSANKRAKEEYQESYELATDGLQKAECLAPSLIQAWFCTHTALLANILATEESRPARRQELVNEAKRLLGIALVYSNHVKASRKFIKAVVDIQQKVYIHLSELYIGLSLSGSLASSQFVSADDISSAKKCLFMVAELVDEGHKLTPMREVQRLLALSALFLRQFQLGISEGTIRSDDLRSSLSKCDDALRNATGNKLSDEMIRYCRQLRALIVEKMVISHFAKKCHNARL